MRDRGRLVLLGVLLLVFAVTVVVAGRQNGSAPGPGVERLGPETGEQVTEYLQRAQATLPADGGQRVWALVQLHDYLAPAAAADLVSRVQADRARLSAVLLRVPLPDVQTALITRDVPGRSPAEELVDATRLAAQDRSRAGAQAQPGSRPAAVAAAEAARLRAGCACVLALLLEADGAALRGLTEQPEVRVVHAAEPGTPPQGLAVSPLLPEQVDTVGPVPDHGTVPPAEPPAEPPG